MTQWRVIETDRRKTFCPIALELRDEFSGGAVIGDVQLSLDLQRGTNWIPIDIAPARTSRGLFVYPGLGRAVDPLALPNFRVRLRVTAAHYRPRYQLNSDGLEFEIATYNDAIPPAVSPLMPEIVLMLPTASYPFGGHIRVLRGRVIDAGNLPVSNASVEADGVERVISDDKGSFTLPLRWQKKTATVAIQVDHPRSGTGAAASFNLPGALVGNHDITVT